MGWTHSWTRPTELPPRPFTRAVADIRQMLPHLEIDLAGFEGDGDPILMDDHLLFNGRRPLHCEPFEIRRVEFDRRGKNVVWTFCKTEKLPYDLCVQIALIVLKHHLASDISVSSDGAESDWENARETVASHLSYGADFELAPSED